MSDGRGQAALCGLSKLNVREGEQTAPAHAAKYIASSMSWVKTSTALRLSSQIANGLTCNNVTGDGVLRTERFIH